jgi:putative endonuclease
MSFYSYVLRSSKNGILYKGSTQNLEKRLQTHNSGKVKFTSKNIPWELVISEEFSTRSEAVKREKWYKSGVGRDWINSKLQPSI